MRTNYPIVMNFGARSADGVPRVRGSKGIHHRASRRKTAWNSDVDKTGLWKGKRHIFTFARYNGKLLYDPQNPAAGKVDLTVEAASIQCQDAWVSPKDLKKVLEYAVKDMLAADKNPEIHFVSTMASAGQVEGMLTIRGDFRSR